MWKKTKRVLEWIPVLWEDKEWDFRFVLNHERKRLEQMRDHWERIEREGREVIADHHIVTRDLRLACRLMAIFMEDPGTEPVRTEAPRFTFVEGPDGIYSSVDTPGNTGSATRLRHVNWRTLRRYMCQSEADQWERSYNNPETKEWIRGELLNELYRRKAEHLYYRLRYERSRTWWY